MWSAARRQIQGGTNKLSRDPGGRNSFHEGWKSREEEERERNYHNYYAKGVLVAGQGDLKPM
jgi:hypothetical protein